MVNLSYLDYCASAPLRSAAAEAMEAARAKVGGVAGINPSSLHTSGRVARELLEASRAQIAALVGADSAEVIFTSGGTEADALALRGLGGADGDVLISAFEHPAVTENARSRAEADGSRLLFLPVSPAGFADFSGLGSAGSDVSISEASRPALNDGSGNPVTDFSNLAIASLMWVNNEVGTVQDVPEFVRRIREASPQALVHSDAIQAAGRIPLDFHASGLDAMSLTAHKFGGPVGVGALVLRRGIGLRTDRLGGGQERQIRSGTQPVLAAVGMAAALQEAVDNMETETRREQAWKEKILRVASENGVNVTVPETGAGDNRGQASENGSLAGETVPAIVHLWVDGATSEGMLMAFDMAGVCVSAGSACHAGVARPSPVMLAMGFTEAQSMGALRVSFGHATTDADIEAFCRALPTAIRAGRALGSR